MKRTCYVVPMDEMIQVIRPPALEEVLTNTSYPFKVEPWAYDSRTNSTRQENWIRSAMSQDYIQDIVWWIELQLFAKLLKDIYLVHSLNVPENHIVFDFKNRLRHQHLVNEEILFTSIFGDYLKFRDLPLNIKLGYNGLSLFIEP